MTLESLARTIAKARHGTALALLPWQLRMLRQIDDYYARAHAVGITRDEATDRLTARMKKAQSSLTYSQSDAFRDARRALLAQPDGAQEGGG